MSRFLPIANISRIMKSALPENAKISKDAKEIIQESVSEFISFITSEACTKCIGDKWKTISGEDVLHSLNILGYEKYIPALNDYMTKYKIVMKHETEDN